ncbi:MAG: hypothetical protein HKL90_02430 [Elusimicrobia bacterium]|nr:hypothetical protein [Elusimicrobiota bacterium]
MNAAARAKAEGAREQNDAEDDETADEEHFLSGAPAHDDLSTRVQTGTGETCDVHLDAPAAAAACTFSVARWAESAAQQRENN